LGIPVALRYRPKLQKPVGFGKVLQVESAALWARNLEGLLAALPQFQVVNDEAAKDEEPDDQEDRISHPERG
jgi:hypothetical protein